MKNIRRSLNKDKSPTSPTSGYRSPNATSPPMPQNLNSFQPIARAQANRPPQKVIKAIESFRAQTPVELSFEVGDFFHVVGERPEDGFFDASNPMTGARGLVPMSCFQVLGRNERDARPATTNIPAAVNGSSRSAVPPPQPQSSNSINSLPPGPSSKRTSGGASGKAPTLYGVVQYDFKAERNDELDAKRGDNIIIIAQSNHEWFVAKPIGRLGGPGLIPVSFVEIQNMATGKALDTHLVQEMIQGGALPGVEEWKKTTAEYKQSSIPLGRFDFPGAPQQQQQQQPQSPDSWSAAATPTTLEGAQRMSKTSLGPRQTSSHYESSASRLTPAYPPTHESHSAPALGERSSYTGTSGENMARFSSSSKPTSYSHETSIEEQADRYGTVASAKVVTFHWEENSYWFHLEVVWDSGAEMVLYRLYDDFYDFQEALKEAFPVEAGKELPPGAPPGAQLRRTLPWLPGVASQIDEFVSTQRVSDLSTYLYELVRMPAYLLQHRLTYEFFLLRPGDVEVQPPGSRSRSSNPVRADQAEGELVEQLRRMPGGVTPINTTMTSSSTSDPRTSGEMNGQRSYDTARRSTPSPAPPTTPGGSGAPSFLKIKIFQRATDDLIAIRVPPDVTLSQLINKAAERLGIDVRSLSWREDVPGLGGAHLRALTGDHALDSWIASGARLVLYAD